MGEVTTLAVRRPPPTRTGRLSDLARHVVLPAGIVSTAWPAVRETCSQIDIHFDDWQDGAGRAILAKRADGLYAADTTVMSIPRQVGKTYLIGAIVFALCIIHPGLTVIWTAHRFKTARETFTALKGLATRSVMRPHVDEDNIYSGAGNESIGFRNGSRIVFGARERGGGRGFAGVDVLVLDEAQILTANAMDDLVPTTNQAPNPLVLLTGTPPRPIDPGESFSSLRREAIDGESQETLYIEFSADQDADPDDREQWAKANPSYPARTTDRAILRLRKILTADSFLREGLGIWDSARSRKIIDADAWARLRDAESTPGDTVAFGVATRHDHHHTTIGVAAERSDGLIHVGIAARQSGTEWVPEWVSERQRKWRPTAWALNPAAPAGVLISPMARKRVEPLLLSGREWAAACGGFHAAVREGTIRHAGNADLASSVDGAGKRPLGDAWQWHPIDPDTDITFVQAVTLALAALGHKRAKKQKTGRVVAA